MRRTSVLIIHADADAADILRLRIRVYCGCDTSVAYDARQALEALERHVPDVIVLDIPRPDVEALALARRLRAADRFRAAVLIALTERGDDAAALRAGCDHHVSKPPNMQILRGLIQEASRSERSTPLPARGHGGIVPAPTTWAPGMARPGLSTDHL